ncbi:hypothetical protein C8J31_102125 [Rhizobium sp. PP-CC-2G-626]|nr:hypothetical protein C8J31_102125 [Rhizobium sp. PP-CC-2G-626]
MTLTPFEVMTGIAVIWVFASVAVAVCFLAMAGDE